VGLDGWVFAYNALTLQQSSFLCDSNARTERLDVGRAPVVDSSGIFTTPRATVIGGSLTLGIASEIGTAGGTLSLVDITPRLCSAQANDQDLLPPVHS